MLRRTKQDLKTKLPDKIEINVNIDMTEFQMDVYIDLLKNQKVLLGGV